MLSDNFINVAYVSYYDNFVTCIVYTATNYSEQFQIVTNDKVT